MKARTVLAVLLTLIFSSFSCEEKESTSQEKDQKVLNDLYLEIKTLVESEDCTNAALWKFTAIGAKACGGPTQYIAYSVNIDTTYFLKLANTYTVKMKEYNEKYGMISDCAIVMAPDTVTCENGKPKLIYNALKEVVR